MDRNKTHRSVCKKTSGKTVCAPAQREAQKEEREMKKGKVHIIFGTGMGKTAMALGRGVSAAMHGRKVIMIQFLKGVLSHETADGLNSWSRHLKYSDLKNRMSIMKISLKKAKRKSSAIFRTGIILQKKYSVPANAIC